MVGSLQVKMVVAVVEQSRLKLEYRLKQIVKMLTKLICLNRHQ